MGETRWLNANEQDAWRKLAAVLLKLPAALESQLQHDSSMTHFEYWVIALVSEAPDRRLRLRELANYANASLSRISHAITRLEKRGWLVREPCPEDARVTLAVLTEAGWEQIVDAAPGHVESVRRLVFDALGREEVDELGRICESILSQIRTHPDG